MALIATLMVLALTASLLAALRLLTTLLTVVTRTDLLIFQELKEWPDNHSATLLEFVPLLSSVLSIVIAQNLLLLPSLARPVAVLLALTVRRMDPANPAL